MSELWTGLALRRMCAASAVGSIVQAVRDVLRVMCTQRAQFTVAQAQGGRWVCERSEVKRASGL